MKDWKEGLNRVLHALLFGFIGYCSSALFLMNLREVYPRYTVTIIIIVVIFFGLVGFWKGTDYNDTGKTNRRALYAIILSPIAVILILGGLVNAALGMMGGGKDLVDRGVNMIAYTVLFLIVGELILRLFNRKR